jgi:hypothetical protein
MPWVGFETTIPVFERAMTFYALDRAATVIAVERFRSTQIEYAAYGFACLVLLHIRTDPLLQRSFNFMFC